MNYSAPEFTSKRRPPTQHVNPTAPMPLQATKLRATAEPFESKKSSPSSANGPLLPPPPPPPPNSPPQYNPATSPTRPSAPASVGPSLLPPPQLDIQLKSKLNSQASPYTPTKLRKSPTTSGTPTFPSAPAAVAATVPPTTTVRQPPPPIAPTTPPSIVEIQPVAEAPPASPKVEEPLPFAGSQLPVPSTPKPAPAEPIKFNTSWTLYADDHPATFGSQTYAPPVQVRDVSDLATFWRLWRYCPPPSRCVPSFTYIWFRREVKPQWEDPKNKNGGSISIALYDRDRIGCSQSKDSMDDAFLLALMSLAGESLPESTVVNGIFLKTRPNRPVVLQYWTNVSDEAKLRVLAGGIRTVLGRALPSKALEKLEFFSHSQLQQTQPAVVQKGKQAGGRPARPKAMEPDFTF